MLCNALHLLHSSQTLCAFWDLFQILLLSEMILCNQALWFRVVFSESAHIRALCVFNHPHFLTHKLSTPIVYKVVLWL